MSREWLTRHYVFLSRSVFPPAPSREWIEIRPLASMAHVSCFISPSLQPPCRSCPLCHVLFVEIPVFPILRVSSPSPPPRLWLALHRRPKSSPSPGTQRKRLSLPLLASLLRTASLCDVIDICRPVRSGPARLTPFDSDIHPSRSV